MCWMSSYCVAACIERPTWWRDGLCVSALQLVSSSLFAVATFLYLSGFLAVTLFSKHLIALRDYLVSVPAQSPARHTTIHHSRKVDTDSCCAHRDCSLLPARLDCGFQGASVSNRAFLGSIPWLIVHRWLRLIPAYAFIIAVGPLIPPLDVLTMLACTFTSPKAWMTSKHGWSEASLHVSRRSAAVPDLRALLD